MLGIVIALNRQEETLHLYYPADRTIASYSFDEARGASSGSPTRSTSIRPRGARVPDGPHPNKFLKPLHHAQQ